MRRVLLGNLRECSEAGGLRVATPCNAADEIRGAVQETGPAYRFITRRALMSGGRIDSVAQVLSESAATKALLSHCAGASRGHR
jgi:hypothetical protein